MTSVTPGTPPGQPDAALVERIRHTLAALGDPQRAAGQQAYMKSTMPYLGVTMGELRRAVRPLLRRWAPDRATWEATLRHLWDGASHREYRYAALEIAHHRLAATHRLSGPEAPAGTLELARYLVTTGAWWDLVDPVATGLVRESLLTHPAATARVLREWAVDPDLWLRRTAIIAQVGAKQRTDPVLLADVIEPNLEGGGYADRAGRQDFFIRKAIGWVLRDYAYVEPGFVRQYVETRRSRMAGLSIREALKHL